MKTKNLIKAGFLSALSLFLMMMFQFPIFFNAPFLKYDFGDVPAVIASFALGPFAGVLVVFLRDLIYLLIRFNPVDLIGIPMNFFASSFFVMTAGLLYKTRKNKPTAVLSLIAATLTMAGLMIPLNYFVYPLFIKIFSPQMNLNSGGLIHFIVWVVTPFNLIKGTINSIVVFLVYKKASHFLKKN